MHSSWVTRLPVRNIFKFPCNVTILDLRSLVENTDLESNYDIFIVPFHNTDTPYIIFFLKWQCDRQEPGVPTLR